jgi:hypothetical protein
MISPFEEIHASLLNDGKFPEQIEDKFRESMQKLHEYNAKYGLSAKKAKSVLTITIETESVPNKVEPGQRPTFSFGHTTQMVVKGPKDHPVVTNSLLLTDDETGGQKVFVQRSGSFKGDPTQQRLANESGEGIDPSTGKASPEYTQFIGLPSVA